MGGFSEIRINRYIEVKLFFHIISHCNSGSRPCVLERMSVGFFFLGGHKLRGFKFHDEMEARLTS